MGLNTSHDCWNGAYSAFHRWRMKLCEVAGYGQLADYRGFGGSVPWPDNGDILLVLLTHSDCDGEIAAEDCGPLADRMEELLPALRVAGNGGGHIGLYADATEQFINGLREAAEAGEPVDFH
jgi:hypothetical protein